jgi:hypothetical protein
VKAMQLFSSAEELLNDGETGLYLFTNGQFFTINPDKTGSSGYWNLDSKQIINRVVICVWSFENGERIVKVFTALPNGFDGPMDEGQYEGRYIVRLLDIHHVGNTVRTWEEFIGTQQQTATFPIYITRKAIT